MECGGEVRERRVYGRGFGFREGCVCLNFGFLLKDLNHCKKKTTKTPKTKKERKKKKKLQKKKEKTTKHTQKKTNKKSLKKGGEGDLKKLSQKPVGGIGYLWLCSLMRYPHFHFTTEFHLSLLSNYFFYSFVCRCS